MASTNNSATTGRGEAEEPGPEPDGSLSSSSSTAASYDPTVFQRPHPDDRAGADGTPRKKGDGKVKSKTKAQAKSKDGKGRGTCVVRGAGGQCCFLHEGEDRVRLS